LWIHEFRLDPHQRFFDMLYCFSSFWGLILMKTLQFRIMKNINPVTNYGINYNLKLMDWRLKMKWREKTKWNATNQRLDMTVLLKRSCRLDFCLTWDDWMVGIQLSRIYYDCNSCMTSWQFSLQDIASELNMFKLAQKTFDGELDNLESAHFFSEWAFELFCHHFDPIIAKE